MTSQLFDLLSDNSSVDHPLCGECTDSLLQVGEETLLICETRTVLVLIASISLTNNRDSVKNIIAGPGAAT